MNIKSEWDLIHKISDKIRSRGLPSPSDAVISIGDDCFAYKISENRYGLISSDMSVQDIHFKTDWATPEQIGYKAMTGNISDISAMGGESRFAFVSIGVPENTSEEFILSLYDGLIDAANVSGTVISGGDTVLSDKIILSISIYGETDRLPVKRNGASPGEFIYITGNSGGSKAGLSILEAEDEKLSEKYHQLIKKHLMPEIRSRMIRDLMAEFSPTAMIDLSDGLLSDVSHICDSSKVGFELAAENIPVMDGVESYCLESGKNLFDHIADSGEEYELIFTSKKDITGTAIMNIPVTKIGKIIDQNYYTLKNGIKDIIEIKGFDHFNRN